MLLSPGKNTSLYIEKASRKREHQKDFKSSIAFKGRRRELKSSASKEVIYCIAVLMIFYIIMQYRILSSFISYLFQYYFIGVDLRDKRGSACYRFVPLDRYKQNTCKRYLTHQCHPRHHEKHFLLFDLETTGLGIYKLIYNYIIF